MANIDLSFRAQSLDNQSPDPVQINDRHLTEEDVIERQELTQKISKISLEGTRVFSKGLHNAFLHGNKFLLETPSEQLDVGDINAPILCYGRVPDQPPVSWSSDVVKAVVGFAEHIGWKVSAQNQEIAGRGVDTVLAEAQKKSRMSVRIPWKTVLWGVGALVIVLSVIWVIYKILFRE